MRNLNGISKLLTFKLFGPMTNKDLLTKKVYYLVNIYNNSANSKKYVTKCY